MRVRSQCVLSILTKQVMCAEPAAMLWYVVDTAHSSCCIRFRCEVTTLGGVNHSRKCTVCVLSDLHLQWEIVGFASNCMEGFYSLCGVRVLSVHSQPRQLCRGFSFDMIGIQFVNL